MLLLIIPEKTALLHNYPNPFNPETWIPYHLAEPAEVTLTIYTIDGAEDGDSEVATVYQRVGVVGNWAPNSNMPFSHALQRSFNQ